MIYDSQTIRLKYPNYANINQKISLEISKKNLRHIKKGLYSDSIEVDAPVISNICYAPSYLSFEYALAYYGLIPERVYSYTSAVFGKKNNRAYQSDGPAFLYRSIPDEVFFEGIVYSKNEDGIRYKIASKEKALCDTLYAKYPVRTIKDLKALLFDNLRIDEEDFLKLDFEFIIRIADKYHSTTLKTLSKYINKEIINDNN